MGRRVAFMFPSIPVPTIFSGPALGVALALLMVALGRRALLVFRAGSELGSFELPFFQITIGGGLLQLLPYGLAAAHALSVRNVTVACALLALLLAFDLAATIRTGVRAIRAVPRGVRSLDTASRVWAILLALLLIVLLVRACALGPVSDDDGYHLSAPKRWLAAGELMYLPTYTTTNGSMGFEMLYTIALSLAGPVPVKVVHYGAGLLTLLGILLTARRMGGVAGGRLAIAGLLVATPVCSLPPLFALAYVDFGASWMATAALLSWLVWRETQKPSWLICMALCVGFAGSFKTTALALGVAWAPVLLWEAWARRVPLTKVLWVGAALGACAFLPVVPWAIRNGSLTGNPVFPLLPGVIPTRDFGPELARVFSRFMHYYSWGVAAGARLDENARKRIVLLAMGAIALAAGLGLSRLRSREHRAVLASSALFMLLSVAVAGMVFRYWLPGMIGAALTLCVPLQQRWGTQWWARWSSPVVMALALAIQTVPATPRQALVTAAKVATGAASLDEAYAAEPGWHTWRFINQATPVDTRVLFISFYTSFSMSSMGGFWIDRRCYTTDSHLQQAVRLDAWPAFLASLRELGVTHFVLAKTQTAAGRHGFSFHALENEYAFGRRLAEERGELLATFDLMQVYRLRPDPTPSKEAN